MLDAFFYGEAVAVPPRRAHRQNAVQVTMETQVTLRPALRPREVWEDICGALRVGEVDGH